MRIHALLQFKPRVHDLFEFVEIDDILIVLALIIGAKNEVVTVGNEDGFVQVLLEEIGEGVPIVVGRQSTQRGALLFDPSTPWQGCEFMVLFPARMTFA